MVDAGGAEGVAEEFGLPRVEGERGGVFDCGAERGEEGFGDARDVGKGLVFVAGPEETARVVEG